MNLIYAFSTHQEVALEQVGGKAMSLIRMTKYGLPVPPGFVLTVAFFLPWLDTIKRMADWQELVYSFPDDLKMKSTMLKSKCADLQFDDMQKSALDEAVNALMGGENGMLFAVRSSSPEEDLEELSFAGGYETVLGVSQDGLESAIKRCFASCLDERVFLYKNEHSLPIEQPRIAVILQQQIPAEVAGVGFTLNPLNNCYDEVVINANFGLGESVVSGRVSPDTFIFDKVRKEILEHKLGTKKTSIWLDANGGTFERIATGQDRLCLGDEQVHELSDLLVKVENYFEKPMDTEWAYAGGKLFMLQARPITAYFPLPEALLTKPGELKCLYGDATLAKWGMPKPTSVLGNDYMKMANAAMLRMTMGDIPDEVVQKLRYTVEGRTYLNVSYSMKAQGKKRVIALFKEMDGLSAELIANIDESEYIPEKLPSELRGILIKLIRQNLGVLWGALQALRHPKTYQRRYLEAIARFRADLEDMENRAKELSMRDYAQQLMNRMMADASIFFPVIIAAEIAKSRLSSVFKDEPQEVRDKVVYLERALPYNVTIAMGLSMYQLSRLKEIRECISAETFISRLEQGDFSPEFMDAWGVFMDEYGFRCPGEMDPAVKRFRDEPAQLFKQLYAMSQNTDPENNPQAVFNNAGAERGKSYVELLNLANQMGKRKATKFEKNYQIYITLGGFRETPKYCFSLLTDYFRRRVLEAAQTFVEAGRIDNINQAFDLTLDELDSALHDPALDLRSLAMDNTYYLRKFKHVREFPRLVDSRGKILRPTIKTAGDNAYIGEPISPGSVIGAVKVLQSPDDKPVLPGEILVTRATDPGWTPLFLNAAGIILEVGGMLQHGALVAREYGKPCISGLMDATEILKDGQIVELDGSSGIVRLI